MILAMAFILFRGIIVVIVVSLAPIAGVMWTLGLLRYFGLEDNPFSFVILPVLLSLVGFTDGVHMMVHIRAKLQQGFTPRQACEQTLEQVGLACFLTSLTTAVGMGSLLFAHHPVVREFGTSCVIGVVCTWVSVMLIIRWHAKHDSDIDWLKHRTEIFWIVPCHDLDDGSLLYKSPPRSFDCLCYCHTCLWWSRLDSKAR